MLRTLTLLLSLTAAATAAVPKVGIGNVNPLLRFGQNSKCAAFNAIQITFKPGEIPGFKDVDLAALWTVIEIRKSGTSTNATPLIVKSVRKPKYLAPDGVTVLEKDVYPYIGQIILELDTDVGGIPDRLFVSVQAGNGALADWPIKPAYVPYAGKCDTPPPPLNLDAPIPLDNSAPELPASAKKCDFSGVGLFPVEDPAKPNVNLSGTWVTGFSTRPLYSIDATVEAPLCPAKTFDLNVGGTIKTAEKKSIDPDSFSAYISAKSKGATFINKNKTIYRGWEVRGGGEFSRKDQFENIVFAPKGYLGWADKKRNSSYQVRYSGGIELTAGVEVGHNRRTKDFRSGYGGIGRLAPAVSVYFLVPLNSTTRSFQITSTYSPRFLLSAEPFTDNRIWIEHEKPFKSFAAGTRHHRLNQVDIGVSDLVSLSFKNEFGSIPPAFNIIDFRFTTGLTIKWKWKGK